MLPYHYETRKEIPAPLDAVFSYLDDHNRLSGHVSQSPWLMAGSRMEIEFDAAKGQAVGSHIHSRGRMLGIPLDVEEVVIGRDPPRRKAWETIGTPRLLVIGRYRMSFEIAVMGVSSLLMLFIDYVLPDTTLGRTPGYRLGGFYARWCTESMAKDTAKFFARSAPPSLAEETAS